MATPNRLAQETSPYLLQHANNPVDWYPWGKEALQKALEENKPILVSIGYAACHWCHVMEHESFEDVQTAFLMNKYFVCIKIDREERPDLDHLFMDALMAISGHGGWPLNMFLTPDGRPFYGGTYYPPVRYQNRISWKELLVQIHDAYLNRRDEIEQQANNLLTYLKGANDLKQEKKDLISEQPEGQLSRKDLEMMMDRIMGAADQNEGGFGTAPKFPQTFTIRYLLRYNHFFGDQVALDQALLSLKKMIHGGIYDQIGGGFCRYSTDRQWLVPHFEKMAYDNALLIIAMAEAYQTTGDLIFKKTSYQTIAFLEREMMTADGAFFSAIDADSEGEEGKFYVWSWDEFNQVLGSDAAAVAEYLDITETGNWEGHNIPRKQVDLDHWMTKFELDKEKADLLIEKSIEKLLIARSTRVRPMTDDKILLGWNALLNQALTKAAVAFSDPDLIELAKKNMNFLLSQFFDLKELRWKHTFKNGAAKIDAFLDDLAFLCKSLLDLYESTSDLFYLNQAISLLRYIDEHYSDEDSLHFYFTPQFQEDILVRKKDLYDGALPSGNAVMAENLHRLGLLVGERALSSRFENMLFFIKDQCVRYPTSNGYWSKLLVEYFNGNNEILILGENADKACFKILREFLPNIVIMAARSPDNSYPMMTGKPSHSKLHFYLCHNYSCMAPFHSEDELIHELDRKQSNSML